MASDETYIKKYMILVYELKRKFHFDECVQRLIKDGTLVNARGLWKLVIRLVCSP